ncbi:transposase family protein [Streptomyces sp. NRRL S-104]|uniref:transposase family protein n=1 Tax=Streptomyces sp. NRRL S-104 TaxID=1609135 RepID=UPI00099BAE14
MIADGGYQVAGSSSHTALTPGTTNYLPGKNEDNTSRHKVRARVEHVFARMKTWKILRACRLKGDGVHHAMNGITRLHTCSHAG